ncbi:hypothetical protein TNIN_118991 [Trichonephila inaurata madagascariensis]|uniref:Uncharacterized protein n=1 Tax=Trichonephila inaurata madagascariensis TaxID=2747483 RepID=A0A8X7CU91_9ARAC|nr:hypothetical protein TNIN_118991 [Trichonephila inaurata madagascariensis]
MRDRHFVPPNKSHVLHENVKLTPRNNKRSKCAAKLSFFGPHRAVTARHLECSPFGDCWMINRKSSFGVTVPASWEITRGRSLRALKQRLSHVRNS